MLLLLLLVDHDSVGDRARKRVDKVAICGGGSCGGS